MQRLEGKERLAQRNEGRYLETHCTPINKRHEQPQTLLPNTKGATFTPGGGGGDLSLLTGRTAGLPGGDLPRPDERLGVGRHRNAIYQRLDDVSGGGALTIPMDG